MKRVAVFLIMAGMTAVVFAQTVGGLSDSDNDGLPDWWEQKYSGGSTNVIADELSGNLGLTYLQAYIAGVSPVTNDPLRVSLISSGNGMRWETRPGRLYSIAWTANLTNTFSLLQEQIPYSQTEYVDAAHSNDTTGFYSLNVDVQYWDNYVPEADLDEETNVAGPNVYAPDLFWGGGNWVCFYGGTLMNYTYHDRIAVTISNGPELSNGWAGSALVIDVPPGASAERGDAIFDLVNDPSVTIINGTLFMVFTAAYEVYSPESDPLTGDIADEYICWSSNAVGSYVTGWTPGIPQMDHRCIISMDGDPDYFSDVGRPAIATDGAHIYLYFDGRTENDPLNSESYCAQYTGTQDSNFLFEVVRSYGVAAPGFGRYLEPDVEYDSSTGLWWMVYQRYFNSIYRAYSTNGLDWVDDGILLHDLSTEGVRERISNPGFIWDQSASAGCKGTAFSTSYDGLMTHKINFYE